MKLAKTVIVSGLLFSSVLGSVNVSSITAMAADNMIGVDTTKPSEVKFVEVKFVGQYGNMLTDSSLVDIMSKKIPVLKSDKKLALKYIELPDNYQFIDTDDATIVDGTNQGMGNFVTVRVAINSVAATYVDKFGNEINDSKLPSRIKVKDIHDTVKQSNLKIPAGFKLVNYSNGMVTLQEIVKSDVNIIFVDKDNNKININGNYVLKNKSVNETISEKDIIVPKGYVAIPNQSSPISAIINDEGITLYSAKIVVKKVAQPQAPSKHPSAPRYTIQRVRITFVDQNSKDLVGYKQVTGKASFSTKIEAPKGYSFTNAKDATIKFDKKGNKDIKIFVKKMTSAPVKHEGVVTTTNGSYKRLYTLEGKMITNRALGVNSKWYTDQYATINGEKMYRVATNEWVKASDVL